MQTQKLYYEDCCQKEFSATVLSCREAEGGWEITLDQTAFYPEGGGQPYDLGTLDGIAVLSVREKDDEILHLCEKPLTPGSQVKGNIDWQRRLDLMQQHTGEHIVSGIINRRFGYHNVGFHMGAEVVTIDFDGMIGPEALQEIETEANRAVWENIPVKCWYPTREELPSVGYRSKKELPWPVRVVEVPGYDICACCGVHTASTGQIGLIKLLSCVKFHQGVRIEMVCGGRALSYLHKICEQNKLVSQAFSAKPLETGAAAMRMNEMLAAEKFRAAGLQKQVFAGIAAGYAGKKNVLHFAPELTPGEVRELADLIAQCCTGANVVCAGCDESGYSLCIASRDTDVRSLGKEAFAALSGRGGGKEGAVQGSVKATKAQIKVFFETAE